MSRPLQGAPGIALTIAGFDPSSGAGLSADLKVFAARGLYGVAAATALTVQSTAGVRRAQPVEHQLLTEMLFCLADDLPLAGIKIGMLATAGNVHAVADFLLALDSGPGLPPVVLDPVLCSSSGYPLLDPAGVECLREELLPLVTCITPNVDELLLLAGGALSLDHPANQSADHPANHPATEKGTSNEAVEATIIEAAGRLSRQQPALSMVVTGGHLASPDDYLLSPGEPSTWLRGEWVQTRATHGTGCGHSSALLCGLVAGHSLYEAARLAKAYVTEALRAAVAIGAGGGSMDHLFSARHIYPASSSHHQRVRKAAAPARPLHSARVEEP